MSLSLILIVAAVALSTYALIDAKGKGLVAWAVLCLAFQHLLVYLPVVVR